MKVMYRTGKTAGSKPERSGAPFVADGAKPEDQATVKWGDGMTMRVATLSVKDLQGSAKPNNISLRVDGPNDGMAYAETQERRRLCPVGQEQGRERQGD